MTERAIPLRLPRALNVPAPRDGAAPIIGNSTIIRALRERIERLSLTDFTVLVEGPSDR